MPGFDRTGPMGAGPMSGGQRGLCGRGQGAGYGPAWGAGYRRGRGMGLRRGFAVGPWYPPTQVDEVEALRAEADRLRRSLDAVQQRMAALEKEAPDPS